MSKLKLKVTLANVKVGVAQGSLINPLQVKVKEELAKIVQLENALEIYWNGKKTINTLEEEDLEENESQGKKE